MPAPWRYLATKLNGDGTETVIADELPLQGVELTDDLTGPGAIKATISPEVARLKGPDGRPLLRRWSTALYAIRDGQVLAGAIVKSVDADGPVLTLDAVGFSAYATGMPYTGADYYGIQVDPLDMVRRIFDHLQTQDHGNIGLAIASTKSPIRIGKKAETKDFTTGSGEAVSFETGPYTLSSASTTDLGKEIDDLAKATPFDYRVVHTLTGDTITHRLDLGYPVIGRRRHDLRFVVGENVFEAPGVSFGTEEMGTEVLVLGAGDGKAMIRGHWAIPTDALRRVVVVESKSTTSKSAANALAEREARARAETVALADTLVVINHPSAPLGSYGVGDEILVQTSDGWGDGVQRWVRIVSRTIDPATEAVTLSLA